MEEGCPSILTTHIRLFLLGLDTYHPFLWVLPAALLVFELRNGGKIVFDLHTWLA